MKFKISKNIDRLDLHDSSLEIIEHSPKDAHLAFDWAKLSNVTDEHSNGWILGKCKLQLFGIVKNEIILELEKGNKQLPFHNSVLSDLYIISRNFSEDDSHIKIQGLLNYESKLVWMSWNIRFEKFIFSWDNQVSYENWKHGAIPD